MMMQEIAINVKLVILQVLQKSLVYLQIQYKIVRFIQMINYVSNVKIHIHYQLIKINV